MAYPWVVIVGLRAPTMLAQPTRKENYSIRNVFALLLWRVGWKLGQRSEKNRSELTPPRCFSTTLKAKWKTIFMSKQCTSGEVFRRLETHGKRKLNAIFNLEVSDEWAFRVDTIDCTYHDVSGRISLNCKLNDLLAQKEWSDWMSIHSQDGADWGEFEIRAAPARFEINWHFVFDIKISFACCYQPESSQQAELSFSLLSAVPWCISNTALAGKLLKEECIVFTKGEEKKHVLRNFFGIAFFVAVYSA